MHNYLRLYAVTDRMWIDEKNIKQSFLQLAKDCEQSILGGVTCIQLREKNISTEDFIEGAKIIQEVTSKYNIPFIINDDVVVALKINANGVHVGQSDIKDGIISIRKKIDGFGSNKILGVSVQTVEQAIDAEKQGADYLGVGAVFTTSTKTDAADVSLKTLSDICAAVKIPVVAIGGINKKNILQLCNTGIYGVAIVSGIFAQKNICESTKELRRLTDKIICLPEIKNIEGAIFDMDGTLLDSMGVWETVGVRYLLKKGIKAKDNLWEQLKPLTTTEVAKIFQEEYNVKDDLKTIVKGIQDIVYESYTSTVQVKPYVIELLQKLKSNNCKMAVATATDKNCVIAALERLNLTQFFEGIFCCTDYDTSKASNKIYDIALNALNTPKENTIIFEDAVHAIQTAKNANYKVLAIQDDYAKDDELMIRNLADWYIEDFSQLLKN